MFTYLIGGEKQNCPSAGFLPKQWQQLGLEWQISRGQLGLGRQVSWGGWSPGSSQTAAMASPDPQG